MLFLLSFLVSIVFLLRTVLIMAGLLKGPILKLFEKYGDAENFYNPFSDLLIWSGAFCVSLGAWLLSATRTGALMVWLGLFFWTGAWLMYEFRHTIRRHPRVFQSFPRWYADLRERTSRYERRQLAYMWLWLPWRLRLIYNSYDSAFLHWADMVIMATTRPEEDNEDNIEFQPVLW